MTCSHTSTTLRRQPAMTRAGACSLAQKQCDSCLRGVGPALRLLGDRRLDLPKWLWIWQQKSPPVGGAA